jgi:hypothetical protein
VAGEDGAKEKVGEESAASIRARCQRAAKLYDARLLACYQAGNDEAIRDALDRMGEESEDAEAGALLEAETANDMRHMRDIADAWLKSNQE